MNMCSWAFSFKTMRARGNGKGKAGNVNARKAKKRERETMFADKKNRQMISTGRVADLRWLPSLFVSVE